MDYFDEVQILRQQRRAFWREESYAECLPSAERLVEMHRQEDNTEGVMYADDAFWLGRAYAQLGRFADAYPYYEAAVRLTIRLKGESVLLADRLTSMAACGSHLKRHGAAVREFEEVVAMRRRIQGETHDDTADSLHNLGNALLDAGRIDEAIQRHQEAMALRTRDCYFHADSLFCLSYAHELQQDYARAEAEAQKALRLRKRAVSDLSHEYIVELLHYAQLCDTAEMYEKSSDAFGAAARLIKKFTSEDHLHYAVTLNAQAESLAKRGEFRRALYNCNKAIRLIRRNLGDYHMICARVLRNLAFLHQQSGDNSRAEKAMADSLRVRAKLVGVTHMDFARDALWLCGLYIERRDYESAQAFLQTTLDTARKKGDDEAFAQLEELFKIYLILCELNCMPTSEGLEASEKLMAFLQKFFDPAESGDDLENDAP